MSVVAVVLSDGSPLRDVERRLARGRLNVARLNGSPTEGYAVRLVRGGSRYYGTGPTIAKAMQDALDEAAADYSEKFTP